MKWRWFWIAVAVFLGCWRVKSYNNFAGIAIVSPLKEILLIGMIGSLIFMVYFLYKKYFKENSNTTEG